MKKLNSLQINELMECGNIKNTRFNDDDFDGSHFSGDFDNKLLQLGYVRVALDRTEKDASMILLEKDILDDLIKKNYSYEKVFECEKLYFSEDEYEFEDLCEAYYSLCEHIFKDLNIMNKKTCMYVDGIDYILNACSELGYVFGKEKFTSKKGA